MKLAQVIINLRRMMPVYQRGNRVIWQICQCERSADMCLQTHLKFTVTFINVFFSHFM